MRRRVLAILIGVTVVVVAGGVAQAAITDEKDGLFGIISSSTLDQLSDSGAAQPQKAGDRKAPKAPAAQDVGSEPLVIGTLETVTTSLDFVTANKTVLHYPDAEYVKPHFSRLTLLPGQYVKVSDPQGKESQLYTADGTPVDAAANPSLTESLAMGANQILGKDTPVNPSAAAQPVTSLNKWAMAVTGDTAIVELVGKKTPLPVSTPASGIGKDLRAKDLDTKDVGVHIDKVAKGTPKSDLESRTPATESVCRQDDKRDVACFQSTYPKEFEHSKPVARLLINGVELCTGWRIGAKNRMITNRHCIMSGDDVANTEIWFNYQCQACGMISPMSLPVTKVMGDELLATDSTLDFSLFTVRNFSAISQFGYLEIDDRIAEPGEEIYIPQHPGGQAKQLAITSDGDRGANCKIDNPTFDGFDKGTDVSYFCDTEGGSSGSPVLSRTSHKVIAIHHLGGCPNSGVRIDLISKKIASKL